MAIKSNCSVFQSWWGAGRANQAKKKRPKKFWKLPRNAAYDDSAVHMSGAYERCKRLLLLRTQQGPTNCIDDFIEAAPHKIYSTNLSLV